VAPTIRVDTVPATAVAATLLVAVTVVVVLTFLRTDAHSVLPHSGALASLHDHCNSKDRKCT